jgi:hypothetical protein
MIVSIDRVVPLSDSSSKSAVNKMKSVLMKQGQIEPLQVHAVYCIHGPECFHDSCLNYPKYIVWHDDAWGNEIVYAARELNWSTLLIVETSKYEE